MDPELRKQPARNEGSHYSQHEIADETKARTLDDLAGQPTGCDADDQDDDEAFT